MREKVLSIDEYYTKPMNKEEIKDWIFENIKLNNRYMRYKALLMKLININPYDDGGVKDEFERREQNIGSDTD